MTNFARAIIIIPTEDIHKTTTLGHEKPTAKTGSILKRKNLEYQSQINFGRSHQIS